MQTTLACQSGISLQEVLSAASFPQGGDIRVSSCCTDSRLCKPGDLFVALIGIEEDGHEYALDAVDRGAVAILAERPLPVRVPTCLVDDTRDAFGRVCQALAGNPSRHLRVIGVTGTTGKTTTSMLLTSVLESAGHQVGVMADLGYCDSIDFAQPQSLSPTPPEFAKWLARMGSNGCTHAVVELSSIGLARRQSNGIELDAACVTNVRRNRLDYHGSVLNYRKAKSRIFDHLQPYGFAVINSDDPASAFFLSNLNQPVLTVGIKNPAELTATVVERHRSEQTFLITAGNETVPVRTHMIGDHHVYNCLSAAAIGLLYGIDLPTIVRGLEAVKCVPKRLERIECGQRFGVFVDSARTPDALVSSLRTLRQVTRGRLICVYGAGGERNHECRPLLGRAVERLADLGVITNGNPRCEAPLSIIHDILDGYDRPSRDHVLPCRAKAIAWALGQANPGDTVVITGNDSDPVHACRGTTHSEVDDRDTVRSYLHDSTKTHQGSPWLVPLVRGQPQS